MNELIKAGRPQLQAVDTVNEWIKELIEQGWIQVGGTSEKIYRRAIRQLFRFMADNHIEQPTADDMQRFKIWLENKPVEAQNGSPGKRLSLATMNLYITVAKSYFKYLNDSGLAKNDCWTVKTFKNKIPKHMRTPARLNTTFQEYEQIKAMITGHGLKVLRDRAIITAMAEGGLRGIEIHRLSHDDLKFIDGLYYFQVNGKGRNGQLELQPITIAAAQAFITYQKALKKKYNYQLADPAFISLGHNGTFGQRITTTAARRIIQGLLDRLDISPDRRALLSAHSLRHGYITWQIQGGASIDQVQSAARHSSRETTLGYIHEQNQQENARKTIEILEKFKKDQLKKINSMVGIYETRESNTSAQAIA